MNKSTLRRIIAASFLVVVNMLCMPHQATASEQETADNIWSGFYIGGSFGFVHHTMYDPNDPGAYSEHWGPAGKLFVGIPLTDEFGPTNGRFSLETTYYYLGTTPICCSTFATRKWAQSHAVSVAVVLSGQPHLLLGSNALLERIHWFIKGGAVAKQITEFNIPGPTEREMGVSWMIGGGAQVDIADSFFLRAEYEFLSQIGTKRAINLMHTPITISVGKQF